MEGKELIRKILRHDCPERIGFCFSGDHPSDIAFVPGIDLLHATGKQYASWGHDEFLTRQAPSFTGEVRLTPLGNIYGRLEEKTKGECIKGALQDGWELFDSYVFPTLDVESYQKKMEAFQPKASNAYRLATLPLAVFAPLRDVRHMDNALMDILLEPENVCAFLERSTDLAVAAIPHYAAHGADGAIIYDDLGMQNAPFFSPGAFCEIFKPYYKKLADALHANGMDFFVHSCGRMTDFIPDFIDAGVDAFQFDQPELHDSEFLAKRFGDRVTFFCPVDIQKIMPSGDEKTIREGTRRMIDAFKAYGGSLIVKDYDNWGDINVLPEWQQWARDTVIKNAKIRR